ncbi:MAG: hypothetical protein R2824_34530 [Saprospiraceae bacterium]|nr:hypothetical protein [Lewinella sp.]
MGMFQSEREVHVTVGRKEGDRYIYECPICDYKVIFDERKGTAGSMIRTGGDPYVRHQGNYTSPLATDISEN